MCYRLSRRLHLMDTRAARTVPATYNIVMQPLVSKGEIWLADGGLLAMAIGVLLRLLVGFALTRNNWLLDSQIIVGGLLVLLINLAGIYLPRALGGVPLFLGLLGWVYAASMPFRYFFLWKTGERAQWLVLTALGLALASFILRWLLARKWSAEIYGKGWAWIDNWASERSLRARVLAKKALVTLGYRRAREGGSGE